MADSLVLTGVKNVSKHTGKELLLTRPKRGGDTHKIKEWWHGNTGSQYVDCSIFSVTVNDETYKLAVATGDRTSIRIDHDGNLNFAFYASRGVSRAALFTADFVLIEHYVLPAMSGGKVMTVKPQGASEKPKAPEVTKKAPVVTKKAKAPASPKKETVPTVKLKKKPVKKTSKTQD